MRLSTGDITASFRDDRLSVAYDGEEFVAELGIGLPIDGHWWWSFDRSLALVQSREGSGRDSLGKYSYIALTYTVPGESRDGVPLIRLVLKAYDPSIGPGLMLVETRALEDIKGTFLEDSFYSTTFNSPVMVFKKELNFLAYTWGLMGLESSRDGGHFPEAVTGRGVPDIPPQLRLAGYSPMEDLHNTSNKPFCPLVLYDDEARTLVVSPFNHFLISPMRVIQTPIGLGIARGLHGSVDTIPKGTTTTTALVFGRGVMETMARWGDWLLRAGGKSRALERQTPLLGAVGFWNCFGSYYTELFRQTDEGVLHELAEYFRERDIPIGYFGLDLWYNYGNVGFAKNYAPDAKKYPAGLGSVYRETGIPYLLHMSAFESPNDYVGRYEFAIDHSSSYPMQREFYEVLAGEFKESGAFGIWPDFLRTQLQNSRSMRNRIGTADRWFDDLAGAFGEQDMVMMMCMPTIGHYLASSRHQNIVAVRTHTDYLNHQKNQVETLRSTGQVRNFLPPQQSIRHNVLLGLLAHSLGLYPSFDVFLTNAAHPEGFADPDARYQALLRAMSAGVVAVGDKVGHIDKGIISELCFPDGRTSRPDHPSIPVPSTLQSDLLAFYTTTALGPLKWVYLAVFNVGAERAPYRLDLAEVPVGEDFAIYDYFASKMIHTSILEGALEPAQGHYYILIPQVGGLYFLGFPGKYITVSRHQVERVEATERGVGVDLRLPVRATGGERAGTPGPISGPAAGSPHTGTGAVYTVAVYAPGGLGAWASGAEIRKVSRAGGLVHVDFAPERPDLSLTFGPVNQ